MLSIKHFDQKYTARIRGWPEGLRPLMSTATYMGGPLIVLTMGAAGFIASLRRGQHVFTSAFVGAAIAFAINSGLKLVLRRRRPHNLRVTTLGIPSYSFPSGHAFGSLIFYGLFAYLDLRYLSHPLNYLLGVGLVSLIILVGLSRVYLGAHYPSDVAGGWILGGLSLLLIVFLVF